MDKEGQKLRKKIFIAKNNIFLNYNFSKTFFKNCFALVCGPRMYILRPVVNFHRFAVLRSIPNSVGNNRLPACPGQANFDPGR